MRPSLQLTEKVRPMMSQSVLFPARIFALATITMLLFSSEANAFRIFHVANSSVGKKPPVVKYIYPRSAKLEVPLDFSVREENPTPVIINQIAPCSSPRIEVHVTVDRNRWYRPRGIRVLRAGVFRQSRIPLLKAGYFGN